MPVYDLTYRAFRGEARRHFRWWTVTTQEVRVLARLRPLQFLLLVPLFHVFLRILQVVAYDTFTSNPNNPLALVLKNTSLMNVNSSAFFDFLWVQAIFVFVAMLLAGSGMICNDTRHNLLEVYFSKPLTWVDYLLGKVLTLVGLGLVMTAVPALFLVVLHNLLAPSWATLKASWWWPGAVLAYSLVIVVPYALGVLAFSAVFKSERFAGLAVAMVLLWDWVISVVLSNMLRSAPLLLIALPTSINRLGEILLVRHRATLNLPWMPALIFVAVACALSLVILIQTARRAEVGA